jgi:hypothetical protein
VIKTTTTDDGRGMKTTRYEYNERLGPTPFTLTAEVVQQRGRKTRINVQRVCAYLHRVTALLLNFEPKGTLSQVKQEALIAIGRYMEITRAAIERRQTKLRQATAEYAENSRRLARGETIKTD